MSTDDEFVPMPLGVFVQLVTQWQQEPGTDVPPLHRYLGYTDAQYWAFQRMVREFVASGQIAWFSLSDRQGGAGQP